MPSTSSYDLDELRYTLRRALSAEGISEKVIEAIERIVIECIRRHSEILPLLRRAIATGGVVNIGQILVRFGCLSFTTDSVEEAASILKRFLRDFY